MNVSVSILAQATASTDVINTTLTNSITNITQAYGSGQSSAVKILFVLSALEIIWILWMGMIRPDPQRTMEELIRKMMVCLIFGVMTFNWGSMAGSIRGYVAGTGASAGGTSMSVGLNPSAIAENGVSKVAIIFNADKREHAIHSFLGDTVKSKRRELLKREREREASADGVADQASNKIRSSIDEMTMHIEMSFIAAVGLLLYCFLGILLIFVHFYVALQVFMISLEFYIIVSITVCFLPFGVNKHTSYLATGAINSVIASAVKLGVLLMILGLMGKTVSANILPNNPDLYSILSLLLQSLVLAFAVSKAPQIANAVFNGSGNGIDLGAAAASTGMKAGGALVGAGVGAASVVGSKALESMRGDDKPEMPDLSSGPSEPITPSSANGEKSGGMSLSLGPNLAQASGGLQPGQASASINAPGGLKQGQAAQQGAVGALNTGDSGRVKSQSTTPTASSSNQQSASIPDQAKTRAMSSPQSGATQRGSNFSNMRSQVPHAGVRRVSQPSPSAPKVLLEPQAFIGLRSKK